MNRRTQKFAFAAMGPALLLAVLGATIVDQEQPQKEKCCFTHPSYQGACVVEPGEGETCESILAYLNNPNSSGKAYCGNTRLRGGWKQVPCNGSSPSCCRH